MEDIIVEGFACLTGARACLGRAVDLQQICFLLSSLLQHFTVLPPEGEPLIRDSPIVVRALVPAPFTLRFVPRGANGGS